MRARSIGLAFAALLVLGRLGHTQDAASKSTAAPTAPAEAPASVLRPAEAGS